MLKQIPFICSALLCSAFSAQAQEQTVRVGQVRSLASLATMVAIEKGYFRAAGIKVEVDDLDTSTDSLAVVAQNRYQIVEGHGIRNAARTTEFLLRP